MKKSITTCNETNTQFLDTDQTWNIRLQDGYFRLYKWYKKKTYRKLLHRYIFEQAYGEIPTGYVIHHKDNDRLNNSLQNLQMMTIGEHTKLHRTTHGLRYDTEYKRAYHKAYRAANSERINAYYIVNFSFNVSEDLIKLA